MPKRTIDTITDRRKARFESVIRRRQPDLTVVLENIWDPHNVSAILRTADAVGVHTVHLLYYIEQAPNLKRVGKQSSASAKKWLEFTSHDSVAGCFAALRSDGFRILASHLTAASDTLFNCDCLGKTAFVFGNEHRGVSDDACAAADGVFSIPMFGIVQSLNASVAAAITLYEACRQRIAAGRYDSSLFDEATIGDMLRDWSER